MKKIALLALTVLGLSSCVSKKQFTDVQNELVNTKQQLTNTKANLTQCLLEKTKASSQATNCDSQTQSLKDQIKFLQENNKQVLNQVENLTNLSQSAASNIKDVISQLSEKDKYINGIRSAMTRKDSLNLAIKYQLTKELAAGIQDEDIIVDVEKTVVYISIADKLLFRSGSAVVSDKAKAVLGKVAKVVQSKPEMEVQVEGYTDNVPVKKGCIKDNWDLSVMRATAVVRVLQNDFNVSPNRLVAAGRSEYVPLAGNDTPQGRATNRRTRIVILPKLDQFFDILEQKPE
jgi:chemotaxis protein MotB